ncbi:unnamed protein product [Echinostoma caproni]|uniref:F5/8 type C domain-containing protein n=1 Tax=Echinostoma caproni TaxID=27848 RepID=A0A3P8GM68_9TREM|nr:unnamed protein product [Echinostoma caproni]
MNYVQVIDRARLVDHTFGANPVPSNNVLSGGHDEEGTPTSYQSQPFFVANSAQFDHSCVSRKSFDSHQNVWRCNMVSVDWDSVRHWSRLHPVYSSKCCEFNLQPLQSNVVQPSTEQGVDKNIVSLLYRIQFRRHACLLYSRVVCTSARGAVLHQMRVNGIGSGMKCLDSRRYSSCFTRGRDIAQLVLGSLCGRGEQDSWIDVKVDTRVDLGGPPVSLLIQCATITGLDTALCSHRQHVVTASEANAETELIRQKRQSQKNSVSCAFYLETIPLQMNTFTTVSIICDLKFNEPAPKSVNTSMMCLSISTVTEPPCAFRLYVPVYAVGQYYTIKSVNYIRLVGVEKVTYDLQKNNGANVISDTIHFVVNVRPADCSLLLKHISVPLTVVVWMDQTQFPIPLYTMPVNCTYEAQTIQLNVDVVTSSNIASAGSPNLPSQSECEKITMILHHSPWVSSVEFANLNSTIFGSMQQEDRLSTIRTRGLHVGEEWNWNAIVQFKPQFNFPNNRKFQMQSLTLEVLCYTFINTPKTNGTAFMATKPVLLQSSPVRLQVFRKANCHVQTYRQTYLNSDLHWTSCAGDAMKPFRRHVNILFGRLITVYVVSFNLSFTSNQIRMSEIFITNDGIAFTLVKKEALFVKLDNTSSIHVLHIPILTRGLRIVPIDGELLEDIPYVSIYGISEEIDHYKFALGPMVSQILTYQQKERIYVGLGPEGESIVMATDIRTQWIGINLSRYSRIINESIHVNTTYVPWDRTTTFNETLTGMQCILYTRGYWNGECAQLVLRVINDMPDQDPVRRSVDMVSGAGSTRWSDNWKELDGGNGRHVKHMFSLAICVKISTGH